MGAALDGGGLSGLSFDVHWCSSTSAASGHEPTLLTHDPSPSTSLQLPRDFHRRHTQKAPDFFVRSKGLTQHALEIHSGLQGEDIHAVPAPKSCFSELDTLTP